MQATRVGLSKKFFVKSAFALAIATARSDAQVDAKSVVIRSRREAVRSYYCEYTAPTKIKFRGTVRIDDVDPNRISVRIDEIMDESRRASYPRLWSGWLLNEGKISRLD